MKEQSISSRGKALSWPYPRRRRFEEELQRAAVTWFKAQRLQTDSRYPFCLAETEQWPEGITKNIIDARVAKYIAQVRQDCKAERPFPLHKWVRHGLSSQAMLFNLVGPLVVNKDLQPLATVFAEQGLSWSSGINDAAFEYEDRSVFNEDTGQPTSIDLVLTEGKAPRIFIEAKLVEPEFGGCSVFLDGDCEGHNPIGNLSRCYLHHIGRKYWTLLDRFGFLNARIAADSMCILANHYQFFREVGLALKKDGIFVLLSDERSPTFWCNGTQGPRGLMAYLLEMVPEGLRERIGRVTVQQLVSAIKTSGQHSWIEDFEKKYGLSKNHIA